MRGYSQMNEEKPKKLKKPLVGAIFVFIFGPFGFLYYSWKKMLSWSMILFSIATVATWTNITLPWWLKYLILPILSIYCYIDVIRYNIDSYLYREWV